jgi:xylan 1,4-beta-xylosidase
MSMPSAMIGLSVLAGLALGAVDPVAAAGRRERTYVNPVDLPYRYQPDRFHTPGFVPYREAADPTLVRFKGRYWMFVSHSKGYWHSTDLLHWSFVEPTGFDVEKYAPTVVAIGGRLYLAASENAKKIWVTDDPMTGQWTEAASIRPGYNDPCLFLDDDGRLYMYEGLSGVGVLRVVELDPKSFQPIAEARIPASRDKANRGWEVVGDHNEKPASLSFIEGAWMTKYRGRYYLQYSAPGTEYKSYAEGVLVADSPMGPFAYQPNSPASSKPSGFIAGAGHGSSFQGADKRWWHVATMSISRRHPFERRLGLFPARFTPQGELSVDTYLGDYPHYVDGDRGLTGWMLLSRHKPATASSSLDGFGPEQAADEEVRSWWSAKTGDPGEWFQIDLGAAQRIDALQVNFADQDSKGTGISGDGYRYRIEASIDGKAWQTIVDAAATGRDAPHDYRVLAKPRQARFVRIVNVHAPDGGRFSLYDLRVFGQSSAQAAATVAGVGGTRDAADPRKAKIAWQPAKGAEFYVVRVGVRPDLLSQSWQVYDGQTSLDIASLTAGQRYFVAVDAVNGHGISTGRTIAPIE